MIINALSNGMTGSGNSRREKIENTKFTDALELSKVELLKTEIAAKYNVNLNPSSTDGSFNNLFISESALQRMVNDPDYKKEIMAVVDTFPRFLQETKTCNSILEPAKGAYMRIRDDGSYVRTADLADEEQDYDKKTSVDIFGMLNGPLNILNNENNAFNKTAEYEFDYSNLLVQFASKKVKFE